MVLTKIKNLTVGVPNVTYTILYPYGRVGKAWAPLEGAPVAVWFVLGLSYPSTELVSARSFLSKILKLVCLNHGGQPRTGDLDGK